MEETKPKRYTGIVAIICAILAFLTSIFVIPSFIFAIVSIILSIGLLKKHRNKLAGFSVVISSISIILTIGILIIYSSIASLDSGDITQIYNNFSKGITSKMDVKNKINGNSWTMGDGSLLELKNDGTFEWYRDSDVRDDNYYTGTYITKLGDEAIEVISQAGGWNEEAYSKNRAVLRTDIYYLELTNKTMMYNGKQQNNVNGKQSKYYIAFYYGGADKAEGLNMGTLNPVSLTKVN